VTLLDRPAHSPEELEASKPLEIAPEQVALMDEAEWYQRAYRRNAPQLTVRALVLGSTLGFFLAFTNVYIGLKTGWFLGVNLTACVLTYAVWTSLQRLGLATSRLSILESTSAVSTASSAGYATGFLSITALPAMLLLSVSESHPAGRHMAWPIVALWIFFVASLGVVIAIPMKRSMINREKLRFPSGTAAAVTLQGLYSDGALALSRARVLFATLGFSALIPLLKDLNISAIGIDPKTGGVLRGTLLPGQSNVFDWIPRLLPNAWTCRMLQAGPAKLHPNGIAFSLSDFHIKLDHGVALAFAGILIGVRITVWMVVGALLLNILIAPPAMNAQWTNALGVTIFAVTEPGSSWKEIGVWIGAPMLAASGLVTFLAEWRTVVRALVGLWPVAATKRSKADENPEIAEVEVPMRWFLSGMLISGTGVVVLARLYFEIPILLGVLAVAMTFLLAVVACRATGETDITPSGPFGQIMQLTYGVLIPQSSIANLQTAAITAGASLASADLLNDLKCGYLLGAHPRRQFAAQAAGVIAGTVATTAGYFMLVPDVSVLLGSEAIPPAFPAPSAQQWKAVAEVFRYGVGNLHPMSQQAIRVGLAVGAALSLAELAAPKRYKSWVPSPTGLGLGMVLPFFYPLAMFVGAGLGALAQTLKKTWAERYLVAIAAGGIAGESIVGVVVQALNNFVLH
jgi:OPT family oligopeptide transporter